MVELGAVTTSSYDLLDEIPVGVVMLNGGGKVIAANTVARAILPIDEMGDIRHWCERCRIVGADGREVSLQGLPTYQTLNDGVPRREVELKFFDSRDKEAVTVLVNTLAAHGPGGVERVMTTLMPIDEQARLSRMKSQLVDSDRLAAMGQLAAAIAHEINNPSAFVIANMTALQQHHLTRLRDLFGELEGHLGKDGKESGILEELMERYHAIELIDDIDALTQENLTGMHRIKGIVGQLRRLTRTPETNPKIVTNLVESVETAVKMISPRLSEGHRLVLELSSTPLEVMANQLRILQVIVTVLNNVIDAVANVENQTIKVSAIGEETRACIIVEAPGWCSTAEERERLLSPGMENGLGTENATVALSACVELVRAYGGEIELHANAAGETRVALCFPLIEHLQ
ncbi:MAG: ATP-binding protein [Bradymonadaceae bacterium]